MVNIISAVLKMYLTKHVLNKKYLTKMYLTKLLNKDSIHYNEKV